jgi:hypothetical protein
MAYYDYFGWRPYVSVAARTAGPRGARLRQRRPVLPPSREASADHRSLGGGGQGPQAVQKLRSHQGASSQDLPRASARG